MTFDAEEGLGARAWEFLKKHWELKTIFTEIVCSVD